MSIPVSRGSGTTPKVVLHIGTPKSGTTYLQQSLWQQRKALRRQGVHLPGLNEREMFRAAIDVQEVYETWGFERADFEGSWQRLCRQALHRGGTTVMSHELLAAATTEQAHRALAGLEGADVHLVVTARDLARQVPSEWQERLKNGSAERFEVFRRLVDDHPDDSEPDSIFWRHHHLVAMFDRWASALPPERVHLIVLPQHGAEPELLWQRFAGLVGFDPQRVPPLPVARNESLGVAQIAVLERINRALAGRIRPPWYAQVVQHPFTRDVLAKQEGKQPTCPADLVATLQAVAAGQNEEILSRGYRVHGDLSNLVPRNPGSDAVPVDATVEAQLEAVVAAIADLFDRQAAAAARRRQVKAAVRREGGRVVRRLQGLRW